MPGIRVKEGESFESALRRFKKKCEKAGIMADLRRHQHFEKPSEKKKRVGVLQGSAAERYLEKRYGDSIILKKYSELTSVMGLVEDGQLDATVEDLPIYIFYGDDFPGLHRVGDLLAPGYYVGYVRKGDESLRRAYVRTRERFLVAIADVIEALCERHGLTLLVPPREAARASSLLARGYSAERRLDPDAVSPEIYVELHAGFMRGLTVPRERSKP